jgi:hypothetical protein
MELLGNNLRSIYRNRDIVDLRFGRIYYLGYGRNAWHSTWISRYYPGSCAEDAITLRKTAEGRRVQGSVFRITQKMCMWVRYPHSSVCLVEINANTLKTRHIDTILKDDPANFLRYIDALSVDNWILPLVSSKPNILPFDATWRNLRSYSNGSTQMLGWMPGEVSTSSATLRILHDELLDTLTDPRGSAWKRDQPQCSTSGGVPPRKSTAT